MPKLKIHSGAKKRVRITKTGKVLARKSHGNHFLEKKTASRKRTYAGTESLEGKSKKNLKRMLGE